MGSGAHSSKSACFYGFFVISLIVCFQPANILAAEFDREAYEQDLIERCMESAGLEPDDHPQGKIIEKIIIRRKPIIEAADPWPDHLAAHHSVIEQTSFTRESPDPWPDFLNIFHVTTREHIVKQELLFKKGDRYDEDVVRESARNLRSLPLLFSAVRIVTARGTRPDKIVVLVITKDLWSLRFNSQFSLGGGVFNYLSLKPTEQNFLGYNQQVSLYTFVDRDTYSIGEIYRVPRLFGSRFSLYESLHLRINQLSGDEEGGFGSVHFGRPLYSINSKWGFAVGASFDIGIRREYEGANIRQVGFIIDDLVYWRDKIWNYKSYSVQAQAVRSFGVRWKSSILLGYTLRSRTYALPGNFPSEPFDVRESFIDNVLPNQDQAGEILARFRFYEASYHRFQNIQTYGLTEDYRFGPEASVETSWANPAFGFAQNSVWLRAAVGYRFLFFGQNIFEVSSSLSVRYWPGHDLAEARSAGTNWVDRRADLYLENVSPDLFGLGRLLVRIKYVYTQYSVNRSLLSLGGDNTLRGFVSGYSAGERLLNFNVEFRSQPWVLRTLHMGFVVFYDGGDAYGYSHDNDFNYHQSLGFGFRGLFPQFDRGSVRLDFGIPLGKDFNTNVIDWVTISYLQAF